MTHSHVLIVCLEASPQFPGTPLYKESGIFRWRLHPCSLASIFGRLGGKLHSTLPLLGVASVQTSPLRKSIKWWPLPREGQDHSPGYLNCPPENEHMVSPFPSPVVISSLHSVFSREYLGAQAPIKPGSDWDYLHWRRGVLARKYLTLMCITLRVSYL